MPPVQDGNGQLLRVLIVEDSPLDSEVIAEVLRCAGYQPICHRVETSDAMAAALDGRAWDVILSDHVMPHFSAPDALALVRDRGLNVPFIIVSGRIGEDKAVAIMRAGAQDYILKENLTRLPAVVERELREAEGREARKRAEETIKHLAFYDRLTDLPNKESLRLRLEEAVRDCRMKNEPVAVMLIKLDNLKEINNTLGHHDGDRVLREAALRLSGSLSESGTVARPSGNEFAVILPGRDVEGAISIACNVTQVLEHDSYPAQLPVEIKTSIGIALCPEHGEEPDILMQRAAVAMWGARRDGSGYALYTADRDPFSPRRLGLMGELRHAIEDNRLILHYQAKVDLETRRVTGTEALVRWAHPTLGLLAPAQFIPLAEQSGLIKPLARWVLNEVLRQHHEWQTQGVAIPIAANLSTQNLLDPQLQDHVAEILKTWARVPISLELEITESSIMAELPRTAAILESLKSWGIRLSVDDFGTGYSSLAYLRKLPVSELKIDKSFVIGMESSVEDGIIVRSIVDLGHNLGLKVVAEGVENPRIWDLVAPLGCDAAQGFHIGPPLPGNDFPCWLKTSDWKL